MVDLLQIFCVCDDFCVVFSKAFAQCALSDGKIADLNPAPHFSNGEMLTILIAFHLSGFHDFKHFYAHIQAYCSREFPRLPSYNRFVELMPGAAIFLFAMLKSMVGECTGTSFIDATALAVCKNKRISSHKVFKLLARRGKTSMGWFYGFKLHLVINDSGQILDFTLTQGNVDDRTVVPQILRDVWGKVFGDKGYISKELFNRMMEAGRQLFTSLRSNMKPAIVTLDVSDGLSRRSLIESVFNVLKNSCRIEHSRHRSPRNFVVNLLAGMCGYMMRFLCGVKGDARIQAPA